MNDNVLFPVRVHTDKKEVWIVDLMNDSFTVEIPIDRVTDLDGLGLFDIFKRFKCQRRFEPTEQGGSNE